MKKQQKTAQRAAIMSYLEASREHPTIIDIYKAVSKKLSTISMTTVYNTMNLLKKEGIVRELPPAFGHGVRFDSDTAPHHHLICNACNNFIDVNLKDIDHSILLSEEQRQGFEVQNISIKIYGVCSKCKNKNSKSF